MIGPFGVIARIKGPVSSGQRYVLDMTQAEAQLRHDLPECRASAGRRHASPRQRLAATLAVAAACAGVHSACADPPAGSNYRLVFGDDFTGTTLDTNKWSAASP